MCGHIGSGLIGLPHIFQIEVLMSILVIPTLYHHPCFVVFHRVQCWAQYCLFYTCCLWVRSFVILTFLITSTDDIQLQMSHPNLQGSWMP